MSETIQEKAPVSGKRTGKGGKGKFAWHLPLIYALIFAALVATAVLMWGKDIRNIIQVLVKLVVKA